MLGLSSSSEHLYTLVDWSSVAENQKRLMSEEIKKLDGNRLLNTSSDDLFNYFVEKYSVDVPVLANDEDIIVDQREVQIDVSRDPRRAFLYDQSGPYHVAGTAIEIAIPFTGDAEVFQIQPTSFTMNPPRGAIRDGCLILTIQGIDLNQQQVQNTLRQSLIQVKQSLETLRRDAAGLAAQLPQLAKSEIEDRRRKLLADQSLVSSLGFRMKQRSDAPQTFRAPEVRRKIQPMLPQASTKPYKPEPALDLAEYENILSIMNNMVLVMERSPSAFASMDEESLRSHFLVQLNGQYEGQATGETFNYEGKTDLLVRSEGRNLFIAEFKYWGGTKKLLETIDQLLGYLSWRDTKAAIVIFNRQKNFSKVVEAIQPTVEGHPNWKRTVGKASDTSFRFILAHRDDANREMIVTVQAYDIPQAEE